MSAFQRFIITTILLIVSAVFLYLIGGRNALIYFPTALFIAIYYYGKKWWNKKCQDLEKAEEEKKEHQRLQSLESIKGTPLHDLIKQIDNPMRETNKKIMREAVMMAEEQIHHSMQSPVNSHKVD